MNSKSPFAPVSRYSENAPNPLPIDPESLRLGEDDRREKNWKRWGPYLSERQWGTVREDYSADGDAWAYFPFAHAHSRAYRWGEDGLLGITDRECRLCLGLAMWNGRDPLLKERLFGLTNSQGNHGEDVKEQYYYLDSTPTHSYLKALYKYPQAEFPYARLVDENRRAGRLDPEFELIDTGIFGEGKYFDVTAEYAKAAPEDLFIRLTIVNAGPEAASLVLAPQIWFRNTWSWGSSSDEGKWPKPSLSSHTTGGVRADHCTLGQLVLNADAASDGTLPEWVYTENETNRDRAFGTANESPHVKDAFHDYIILGKTTAVNPARCGTKAAAIYRLTVPAGASVTVRMRLRPELGAESSPAFGPGFDRTFAQRIREADDFYASRQLPGLTADQHMVARQAAAGVLWSKQFYYYIVADWLDGDPGQPTPPRIAEGSPETPIGGICSIAT